MWHNYGFYAFQGLLMVITSLQCFWKLYLIMFVWNVVKQIDVCIVFHKKYLKNIKCQCVTFMLDGHEKRNTFWKGQINMVLIMFIVDNILKWIACDQYLGKRNVPYGILGMCHTNVTHWQNGFWETVFADKFLKIIGMKPANVWFCVVNIYGAL